MSRREHRTEQLMNESFLSKYDFELEDIVDAVLTIACMVAIGVMLAWRG